VKRSSKARATKDAASIDTSPSKKVAVPPKQGLERAPPTSPRSPPPKKRSEKKTSAKATTTKKAAVSRKAAGGAVPPKKRSSERGSPKKKTVAPGEVVAASANPIAGEAGEGETAASLDALKVPTPQPSEDAAASVAPETAASPDLDKQAAEGTAAAVEPDPSAALPPSPENPKPKQTQPLVGMFPTY